MVNKIRVAIAAILAAFLLASPVLAQETRSQLSTLNNNNIKSNGVGGITGPILNNVLGTIINSIGALADTNAWTGLNTFADLGSWSSSGIGNAKALGVGETAPSAGNVNIAGQYQIGGSPLNFSNLAGNVTTSQGGLYGATLNAIPYGGGAGTLPSFASPVNNAVLATNGSGVPAETTAIPNGVTATTQTLTDATNDIATNSFVQSQKTCQSFIKFGGVGDGTTANDTAWATAVSAIGSNGCLYFPAGTYKFASAKSWTLSGAVASITLEGDGPEASILYWPNTAGGMTLTYAGPMNSTHVRDLTFSTGQAAGGVGLTLTQGGTCLGAFAQSTVERVTFRGNDNTGSLGSDYWTTAYEVNGVSGTNEDSLTIYGSGSLSTALGVGVLYQGISGSACYSIYHNLSHFTINNLNDGIVYGSYTQGVTLYQGNLQNDNNGFLVGASKTGNLSQLNISAVQFATYADAINISTAVGQVTIQNSDIFGANGNSAINLVQNAGFAIVGNTLNQSGATNSYGIVIGTTTSGNVGTITGNQIIGFGADGVLLQAASAGVNVQSNAYHGNGTNVVNSGTGNTVGGGSQ